MRKDFSRREIIKWSAAALASGAGAFGLGGPARAQSDQLVVSDFGGDWATWNKQNIDAKFTSVTNLSVLHDTGSDNAARIAKAKLGIERGEYDLICLADSFFPRAVSEGILDEVNYDSPAFTNHKDVDSRFVTPNYTSFLFNGLGLGYNPRMVSKPPTSWADLWNPEFKGKIVLPAIVHSFGLHVILLSALAAGKDYKDTKTGLDHLKRLADLDPIWTVDSQANARSLFQEESAIGWIGRAEWLQLRDWGGSTEFVLPSEGGFLTSWGFSPVKGSMKKEQIEAYINITLDPQLQAANAKKLGFQPTNKKWTEFADEGLVRKVSWTPEEEKRFISVDYSWLNSNRAELTDSWNRIVGR
ncbi:ABC transporter substrate-binding protein [Pseudaminobacter sp. NGMCC 1.201702]|uniref:ABC transporter substrate-binding protein n=1 Tax=Pseudaminobacter sp. NGMCC 1.201702 TaxID=3391825 RepID=UPI0039EF772B